MCQKIFAWIKTFVGFTGNFYSELASDQSLISNLCKKSVRVQLVKIDHVILLYLWLTSKTMQL